MQLVFFMMVLYQMIILGASILISQNLGANKTKEAQNAALGCIVLSCTFAVFLSVVIFLLSENIIGLYSLEINVHGFALEYLRIFSAGSIFTALSMTLGTILRSYGYSREPMIVNTIAMVISVIGNYIFIFGPFGIPVLGVKGVALSTVFSQFIACIIFIIIIKKKRNIQLPFHGFRNVNKSVYRQILSVGVPTAGEHLSFNLAQIVIMGMYASLGTEVMAATVYTITLLRFVFLTSMSIGNAAQIKVGYFVGAGLTSEAKQKVYRYFFIGFSVSLFMAVLVMLFRVPLINIFTQNVNIHELAYIIFMVSILQESGRAFNIILIPSLKGAGDVRFPVYMGIIFMWSTGVLPAYIFGFTLGWGLLGIRLAQALDEWVRGIIMLMRWRNGRWQTKSLV